MTFYSKFYTIAFGESCKVFVICNHVFIYKSLSRFRIIIEFI